MFVIIVYRDGVENLTLAIAVAHLRALGKARTPTRREEQEVKYP